MFKINRASGMTLFKSYQSKGKIKCIRGKEHNPISFYTDNLAFIGDGSTFTVKSKYNSNANALNALESYIKTNMPNAFSA